MAYRIELKAAAIKALAHIEKPQQRRIARTIDALAHQPRPAGCVKIAGSQDAYRVRVGDYRIVYRILDQLITVCVVRIGHRKDVYRNL
jgi:mRNA interferase RelE/StbE